MGSGAAMAGVAVTAIYPLTEVILTKGLPPPPLAPFQPLEQLAAQYPYWSRFRQLRRHLWSKLRWENDRKEIWWRLTVNGVANNARMGQHDRACACGGGPPDRLHHFWECPVATTVVSELQAQLPGVSLARHHVWLMHPPAAFVVRQVWQVVCMVAVAAMHKGCCLVHGWAAHPDHPNAPPPAARVTGASVRAVAYFWEALDDFVSVPGVVGFKDVSKILERMGADHPFLCSYGDAIKVRRVPAFAGR